MRKIIILGESVKTLLMINLLAIILLAGCAYSIANIDVSNKDSTCVRQCTANYSTCVSGGRNSETLRACREAYSVCIETCPVL